MTTEKALPDLEIDEKTGRAVPVTEAETFLLDEIGSIGATVISVNKDVNDPDSWTLGHTIRAALLKHLCLHPDLYGDNLEEIIIIGARIAGHLFFKNAKLAQSLRIHGCRFDTAPWLMHAQVPDLSFVACHIPGVVAHDMTVQKTLTWHSPIPLGGYLNLSRTHVGEFSTDSSYWPEPGNLMIDGFTYDRLNRSLSVTDHIKWIELMANERGAKPFFYHQPWEQARKAYRDEGDTAAARQINMAYDAAQAQFQLESARPLLKPLIWLRNVLYDKLAGHGHNLFRVVPWMALCMVVFFGWSSFAYHHGSIAPTASRIYMSACYLNLDKTCEGWELHPRAVSIPGMSQPLLNTPPLRLPEGYPAFHAVLYTLDTFIPFADLHQENYWTVTDDGPWGEWMRAIFSVFVGLGGVLSAIFAAGMFSLIRKN